MIVSYLEITDPAQIAPPAQPPEVEHEIERVHDPQLNRRLYAEIGGDWAWTDRLGWDEARWERWAGGVETWVVKVGGEPAGYAELRPDRDSVLLAIFGLLREHHGRGLGGAFLTHVLRRGFELGNRVWASTNTRDGPHALANYEARGMRVFDRTTA